MSDRFLEGRTALITGSTQGIGLAIAEALAAAGCHIGLHGLADKQTVEAAKQRLQDAGAQDIRYFDADLRSPDAIEAMMADTAGCGGVDILVNNAGVQRTASLADADRKTWDTILAVNLSAAFHTMRLAMPAMGERGYGRVVNIASVHGLVASVDKAPYVASKFGIVGLSRVSALEYASRGDRVSGGVTVNCICPGWTETELIEPQIDARTQIVGGGRDAGIADLLKEKQPTLRMSEPSEIGSLAVWLCHRHAHNITGTAIPVDGGWTAQ
ncbi:3-hydroxybutyrate dehydrogenase [Hoeflea prorocentri]|uniref:3-hydroxybutyrate dehydrogenase n=1 Tax=Hoeflea prorocentri TaxID=1922333 RepID=A0A9X3UKL7_9HYPH|nr:3-hydroxybutyrate dehydrogenase [Hoeflea prorocentri]MCY6380884.1 3-hydroxybutyrate dehydrogenase [Hoeflea prorocentri]MDA5398684.1 3-hydroxybutyrate dehydrogenase [Hoeflea prorocentri]